MCPTLPAPSPGSHALFFLRVLFGGQPHPHGVVIRYLQSEGVWCLIPLAP